MEHQLAAILYADVADYSRLTGQDEIGTHQKLNAGLSLLADVIVAHGGRKVHEAGDAILAEFRSVTPAIDSAIEFQLKMFSRNIDLDEDDRLNFRIGVNLGEVIHDREDIYGDGVNLAARIQELAEPGGVCISSAVYEQIKGKVEHAFDDLGYRKVKNIAQSIHVYRAHFKHARTTVKNQDLIEEVSPFLFGSGVADRIPLITGRCMCGDVCFETSEPPISSGLCHCRMCQRSSSATFAAWSVFRPEAVSFPNSEPTYYKTSPIAERGFCAHCGTRLTMRYYPKEPSDNLAILTASLDRPEDFAPTYHLGIESQMPWLHMHDDLPRTRSEDSPVLHKRWQAVGVLNPADWK